MKIQKILWLAAILFLFLILLQIPKKEKETIKDGNYQNAYMISLKEEEMEVLIEGTVWTIPCHVGKEEEKIDKIVDILIENGKVKKIIWKEGQIEDKVLAVNQEEQWMELDGAGKMELSEAAQIYIKEENGVRLMTKMNSLLNWEKASIYVKNQKIEAIIVSGDQNKQTIKVLIHGEKDGIYHEEVRLTASGPYTVTKNQETATYEAGEELHIKKGDDSYHIQCEDGKIRILSISRHSGYPEYRGEIVINRKENGWIVLNELLLEEYLYGVVSSEMPSSYPEEALKAQAVCARTYALYQMEQSYYSSYGAHVDDTVNSQVYNNIAETKQSKNAVVQTKGQYLQYQNEPIPAYFYSTSCGITSDVNDVWIKNEESPEYLKGHFQGNSQALLSKKWDLSEEDDFTDFITSVPDCYEKEEDWFRWSGKMTKKQLSNHINQNVKEGQIGTITKIEVLERSKGGVLKEIKITGEKGTICVKGEYQIRKVLCPDDLKLTLQNRKKKTVDMLPSGYFMVKVKKNKIEITGGGYGHGVGLSQNGAKSMAASDHNYEDILLFYYPGTSL